MADIARTRTIAATPHDVWNVLADFGAISTWVDRIDHSSILVHGATGLSIGTTRRIQIGRNTVIERIVDLDPPHTVAYAVEGLPRMLGNITNRWSLRPDAESTAVTLTSTIEIGSRRIQQIAERVMCRGIARESDSLLAGLAQRMEKSRV